MSESVVVALSLEESPSEIDALFFFFFSVEEILSPSFPPQSMPPLAEVDATAAAVVADASFNSDDREGTLDVLPPDGTSLDSDVGRSSETTSVTTLAVGLLFSTEEGVDMLAYSVKKGIDEDIE